MTPTDFVQEHGHSRQGVEETDEENDEPRVSCGKHWQNRWKGRFGGTADWVSHVFIVVNNGFEAFMLT